jgi:Zn ribbon nucleic-acid-binding protein
MLMSHKPQREDKVKRPDHYQCLECGKRFNDAKLTKVEKNGVFIAQALCPHCDSYKLKISWWKKST